MDYNHLPNSSIRWCAGGEAQSGLRFMLLSLDSQRVSDDSSDTLASPSVHRVRVAVVDASPQIHPHTAPTGGVNKADLGSAGCRGEHVMAGNGLASVHCLCNSLVE